jgi:hypothetical protein
MLKVRDGDYDTVYQLDRVIDSDHPTYLFVKLMNLEEYVGDEAETKYHMSIVASGPEWVSDELIESVKDTIGFGDDDWNNLSDSEKALELADYGSAAVLYQNAGDDKQVLLKEAEENLVGVEVMFGFYMDDAQNMIGATGWDFIKGEIMPGV